MRDRISITHLAFVGHGRPSAKVEFGPKVTVVRGPSDTGKSFIADSIDFMLGAQKLRKIPQLTGYTTVLLGLVLPGERFITVTRQVSGGGYTVYAGTHFTVPADQDGKDRGAVHDPRKDSGLSNLVLDAIGLNGRLLRKNAHNKKISFTLRHLAHLTVISETRIQARTAPPLTGQNTDQTVDKSALKLLLLGEDDSALEEIAAPKERRTIRRAKSEVFDQLLSEARRKVEQSPDAEQLDAQLVALNATIRATGDDIDVATRARVLAARRLAALQTERTEVNRRVREIRALSARFDLLTRQYDSDLARLEMVSEAGSLLGYFTPETCPFCGAEPGHQHVNLEFGRTDATALAVVVARERDKTTALRGDLQQAIKDLRTEATELSVRNRSLDEAIVASETALRTSDENLQPRKRGFDELLRTRSSIESAIAVYSEIDNLELMRAQIEEEAKPKRAEPVDQLPLAVVTRFSAAIRDRLLAWGFPGADNVRFDRDEFDIVDDEQLRASHGKGVRAVLHAAFTLALADFCLANDLSHPGFVVLDSPLVTYKPPKEGEASEADDESARRLDGSFVARFYRDLQATENVQVIIMENTDPPEEPAAETVDIEFTDSDEGRRGFLATTPTRG